MACDYIGVLRRTARRLRFADGDVYDGSYVEDSMQGHGTYTYVEGDIYSGEFREGKKHAGRAIFADGDRYEV